MQLSYRELSSDKAGCPLIMLHGLFGSSINLQHIGNHFAQYRPVILPDLRNHGRSFHDEDVSYQAMARDLLSLMDTRGCEQVDFLGHSMGGKVAMWLALNHPERVNHLVIADISPVTYPNRFQQILKAMQTMNLSVITSRQAAEQHLASYLSDQSLRNYLLQNLLKKDDIWQWRINLTALANQIETIMAFPETSAEFDKPVLFLKGELSDYISEQYESTLLNYFPLSEIQTIEQAGHWLYAEKPDSFIQAVQKFLPHFDRN